MKGNVTELLRKIQFPVIIALASIPATMVLYALWGKEQLFLAWVYPLLYCVLAILSLLVKGKRRLWFGGAETAAILALGIYMAAQTGIQLPLLTAMAFGGLLLYSLTFAGWEWHQELPPVFFWAGIILHLLTQIFLIVIRYLGSVVLEPAVPTLTISFFLLVVLTLLYLNRSAMAEASMRRQKASNSMRIKNLLLTGVFFAGALLISMIPSLWNILFRLWTILKNFLDRFQLETEPAVLDTYVEETEPGEIVLRTSRTRSSFGLRGCNSFVLYSATLGFGKTIYFVLNFNLLFSHVFLKNVDLKMELLKIFSLAFWF